MTRFVYEGGGKLRLQVHKKRGYIYGKKSRSIFKNFDVSGMCVCVGGVTGGRVGGEEED